MSVHRLIMVSASIALASWVQAMESPQSKGVSRTVDVEYSLEKMYLDLPNTAVYGMECNYLTVPAARVTHIQGALESLGKIHGAEVSALSLPQAGVFQDWSLLKLFPSLKLLDLDTSSAQNFEALPDCAPNLRVLNVSLNNTEPLATLKVHSLAMNPPSLQVIAANGYGELYTFLNYYGRHFFKSKEDLHDCIMLVLNAGVTRALEKLLAAPTDK